MSGPTVGSQAVRKAMADFEGSAPLVMYSFTRCPFCLQAKPGPPPSPPPTFRPASPPDPSHIGGGGLVTRKEHQPPLSPDRTSPPPGRVRPRPSWTASGPGRGLRARGLHALGPAPRAAQYVVMELDVVATGKAVRAELGARTGRTSMPRCVGL